MRRTRLVFLSVAFLVIVAWSREQDTTPPLTQSKIDSASPAETTEGSREGEPPACPAKFDDGLERDWTSGKNADGVTPPKVKQYVEAKFSDEARREIKRAHIRHFEGTSVLNFVLNEDGEPTRMCLMKAAGYGLDVEAAKAVSQYRFEPARRGGKPIPTRLTVEVKFKLY